MNTVWKRTLYLSILTTLVSAILIIAIPGNSEGYLEEEVPGKPMRIGPHEFSLYPDVWENRIVYEDERYSDRDIYLFDMDNMTEFRVTSAAGDQEDPLIWGDNIIWEYWDFSETNIYLYNLQTGGPVQITPGGSSQYLGGIWEDRIVWGDYRHSTPSVYLYNITTGIETRVVDLEKGFLGLPDIDGDRIVYTDDRDDDMDYEVYLYDLSTGRERTLSGGYYSDQYPKISGDYVVFENDRGIDMEYVMVKDINGGNSRQISPSGENTIVNPDIFNNKVVWADKRSGYFEIFLFDINTGRELQITDNIGLDHYVRIHGDRLVWSGDMGDVRCLMTYLLDEDADGVSDSNDAFPLNPNEYMDTDEDGIGDNMDDDRDGDGIPDQDDEFVLDPTEWNDFDNDGMGDNSDKDDDNDGILDVIDDEPLNPINGILDGIDNVRTDIHFVSGVLEIIIDDIEEATNKIENLDLSNEELNSTVDEILDRSLLMEEKLNDVLTDLEELDTMINDSLPEEVNLSGMMAQIEDLLTNFEMMNNNISHGLDVFNDLMIFLENYTDVSGDLDRIIDDIEQLDQLETEFEDLEKDNKDTRDLVESGNLTLYIIIFVLIVVILLLIVLLVRTGKRETIDDFE